VAQPHLMNIDQRKEAFVRAAREAAATVTCVCRDPQSIAAALLDATRGADSIVMAESEFIDRTLLQQKTSTLLLQPTDEKMASAAAGITDAFGGVASSGSVCVEIGDSLTPAASLLMPLHVVLIPEERIVNRPRDLFNPSCLNGAGLNKNYVFITGPSATADMGPLVRGVHGPHRLHILLLES
jgi:L-lactate dehydrogenase complex protein LldG